MSTHPEIHKQASLNRLSTFHLSAKARELATLESPESLTALFDTKLPVMLLGGGSNTLFVEDYDGRVIVNRLTGIASEVLDHDRVLVTAGAGENWHSLVRWSLDRGMWGIENLALIPGSVGAAPMQNIGAYGVELAHCLEAVQVLDRNSGAVDWLPTTECGLDYRDSRFKSVDRDRFVILAVRLELKLDGLPVLEYPSLLAELRRLGHPRPEDPRTVAAAVIRIRKRKLPDPDLVPNAGSFFKNPVVGDERAGALIERHPDLPHWPDRPHHIKLSAAWMIDQLGWRGKAHGGAAVSDKHALVLINRGNATGDDVLGLAGDIQQSIAEHYGIELEPEPVIVGGKEVKSEK